MFDAGYPIIILKFEQTCFLFSLLFDFSRSFIHIFDMRRR